MLTFANNLYYKFISCFSIFLNNKHWLRKHIAQILPPLSRIKNLKSDISNLYYDGGYIGKVSFDNKTVIIKDPKMLTFLNKDNADCFHDDFLELSQMVYFVFCYLFMPSNSEDNYKDRWSVFFKALKHDKITSFGKTIKATVDLLINLNNNKTPPEFANTLKNCNRSPPILTEFGIVLNSDGLECKLLHYTVKIPNSMDHISVVLLDRDGQKYYKLSKIYGLNRSELIDSGMGFECFKFNINEFLKYSTVSEFIGDFSMMMVKGINPDYKEEKHPTILDKIIFDMAGY
jgi:hypothetical protein